MNLWQGVNFQVIVNSLPVFLRNPLDKIQHMNIIKYEQMLIYRNEEKEESEWRT